MSLSSHAILVIEDDANDVFFLKRALGTANIQHELRHVEDGQQAIDYLQGVGPFFDRTVYPLPSLILLDLKLSMKHGFDVLAWLRQQPLLQGIVVYTCGAMVHAGLLILPYAMLDTASSFATVSPADLLGAM